MSNGKDMIILLAIQLIKKVLLYKMSYFPDTNSKTKIEVELDLSNYATKSDLKNATGVDVDTSDFAKKTDLANLKSNFDKLDIDKLKNVPSGLGNYKVKQIS